MSGVSNAASTSGNGNAKVRARRYFFVKKCSYKEGIMTTKTPTKRRYLLPILIALMGLTYIVDYFYQYTFLLQDLLRGAGFLLVVPSAYLSPMVFSTLEQAAKADEPLWAKRLCYLGIALIVAGFIIDWS